VFYLSSKLLTIWISVIEVEYYSRGENRWMTCPRLRHRKGSLAGTTLNDKIFAIGGGDGSVAFSEVEMFDPALGRWIDSLSMRQNVWYHSYSLLHLSIITGLYYLSTPPCRCDI
jgi:hypothetical protein